MYLIVSFMSYIKIISVINLALKKNNSSIVLRLYKNDFKYLDFLANYGYIYYTYLLKRKIKFFDCTLVKSPFFFIQIFFNNFFLLNGGFSSLKKIFLVSKSVSPYSLNNLGYSKHGTFSFIQPIRDNLCIVSTSKGLLPSFICKKYKIGGILLFYLK